MHPDYKHNPPNIFPPCPPLPPCPPRPYVNKKSFYLILFVHSRNREQKGQAIVYRRKTMDMLLDLIGDIDEQYYHTMYDNTDLTYLALETRDIDLHFRVVYTSCVHELFKYIDPNGYTVRFDWQDIPNMNYPNQFNTHPLPNHIHRHPIPPPRPPGTPPLPSDYIGTQFDLDNDCIEIFGDEP